MPTTTIDARATFQEDNKIWLELQSGDRSVEMTALSTMTLEEIAELILSQQMPDDVDKTLQRRYTIDWHLEEVVDPETSFVYSVRVVDSVTQVQLLDEAARDGFENLPGWATWTADQASDWIDGNVTDLDSAKIALTQMAKAIVYLRDWRRD